MFTFLVSDVLANGLAPLSGTKNAGMVIDKFKSRIYTEPAHEKKHRYRIKVVHWKSHACICFRAPLAKCVQLTQQ